MVEALGIALRRLAEGDLTSDLEEDFPEDYQKLRTDFNEAVRALRKAVAAVTHNAESIRNETKEITSAADDLSRRTEKQAATLEETAAAISSGDLDGDSASYRLASGEAASRVTASRRSRDWATMRPSR
mgnify:CR=1 FL=1